jgi:hypothetical protein
MIDKEKRLCNFCSTVIYDLDIAVFHLEKTLEALRQLRKSMKRIKTNEEKKCSQGMTLAELQKRKDQGTGAI